MTSTTFVEAAKDFGLISIDIVPYLLPVMDAAIWLFTGDSHAFAGIIGNLLNFGFNALLRKAFGLFFPTKSFIYIPQDCAVRCTPRVISWLEQCGGLVDMPSFHAQAVGYYTAYWLLTLSYSIDSHLATIRKVGAIVLLLIAVYLMMYARFFIKCSTLAQLSVGYIVGFAFGVLYFYAIHFLVQLTTGNSSYF